jgi:nicotinate-nucleotide--dimethylbenzimidazole phosphoribosyltransferase
MHDRLLEAVTLVRGAEPDATINTQRPSFEFSEIARKRQSSLTKPAGSLGRLEQLAIDLCGLQATERPHADNPAIVIFAGDHGVTAQGISAYPSAVTVEMLRNFANGGAAINVLARAIGARLLVVDVGTLAETTVAGVQRDKPRCGTRDFSVETAMSSADLDFVLSAGRRAINKVREDGADIVVLGEMGIGNTTSAAAIAAALLGCSGADIVGAGTGLGQDGIRRKAEVVSGALAFHKLDRAGASPLEILSRVGGFEIAALTGAILAATQYGLPILIDGFIVTVAALAAVRINPQCRPWLLFSHVSEERGHRLVLDALDAKPLLDLGLRLGEGSGAAIALPVVRLACKLHSGMATFAI